MPPPPAQPTAVLTAAQIPPPPLKTVTKEDVLAKLGANLLKKFKATQKPAFFVAEESKVDEPNQLNEYNNSAVDIKAKQDYLSGEIKTPEAQESFAAFLKEKVVFGENTDLQRLDVSDFHMGELQQLVSEFKQEQISTKLGYYFLNRFKKPERRPRGNAEVYTTEEEAKQDG